MARKIPYVHANILPALPHIIWVGLWNLQPIPTRCNLVTLSHSLHHASSYIGPHSTHTLLSIVYDASSFPSSITTTSIFPCVYYYPPSLHSFVFASSHPMSNVRYSISAVIPTIHALPSRSVLIHPPTHHPNLSVSFTPSNLFQAESFDRFICSIAHSHHHLFHCHTLKFLSASYCVVFPPPRPSVLVVQI